MSLQKRKKLKFILQLQDKAILHYFGGKGNRKDPRSQQTFNLYFYLQTQVRDHHQSAFTAASRADSVSNVLPYSLRRGREHGVHFGPKGPGRTRPRGVSDCSMAGSLCSGLALATCGAGPGKLAGRWCSNSFLPSWRGIGGAARHPEGPRVLPCSPCLRPRVAPAELGGWSSSAGFPAEGEEGQEV